MASLSNVKWEKFSQAVFSGLTLEKAAIEAGYAPKWARSTGSVLSTKPNILARIAELNEMAASARIMSVIERKERLSEIARGDLTDFVSEDGSNVSLTKKTPNHRAATEYSVKTTYTKQGNPVVTKEIKLLSPIQAIAELNKMAGDYAPEKIEHSGKVEVDAKSTLIGAIARLAARIGQADCDTKPQPEGS